MLKKTSEAKGVVKKHYSWEMQWSGSFLTKNLKNPNFFLKQKVP